MSIDIDIAEDLAAEPRYRPIGWAKFVEEVLESYRPPLRAAATYRGMKHALDVVTSLVAVDGQGEPLQTPDGQPVPLVDSTADLTPRMIAQIIRTRPPELSPQTVRALLRYVRTACNIAIDSGRLRISPFRRNGIGKLVRVGRPKGRRHLSRADIRTLLDYLAAQVEATRGWRQWKWRRLLALVALIAYTGLRRNEALMIHVADTDLGGRMLYVQPRADNRLKTERSAASVPLPPALVPYLEAWLAHRNDAPPGFKMPAEVPWMYPACRRRGPWKDGAVGDKPLCQLKAAAKAAGIGGDVNWQMLRRSLATHLRTHFRIGRDLTSQILRHSEAVDDAFYLEDDADNLRRAVEGVDF